VSERHHAQVRVEFGDDKDSSQGRICPDNVSHLNPNVKTATQAAVRLSGQEDR
jgi:hypothetical protein